ncbi:hypothetical protein [Clostridium sp. UBA5988]
MKTYLLRVSKIIICMSIILGLTGVILYENNKPFDGEVALLEY